MTSPSPPSIPASSPPPPYEPRPPPYVPPPPPPPSSSLVSAGLIAGIAGGLVGAGALLLGLVILITRRRRRVGYDSSHPLIYVITPYLPPGFQQHPPSPSSSNTPLSSVPPPDVAGGAFKYEDLASATNGFAKSNVLGQGRFGLVYKGTLNGIEVAIKKLKLTSVQGDRDFRTRVEIISRVHHRNTVTLFGYCIHEDKRYLVYEYVPNKSLDFHLHESGRPTLDWHRRWKIALGSAKGDPKIIHWGIKATNILVHYNFEPKVADFGLATFVPTNMSHACIAVRGTSGYVAPEYLSSGKLTDRSDVYSYGVVLLELITGRKPDRHMDSNLVNWARPLLSRATSEEIYDELIDQRLETNYDQYDMTRLIHCAAAAVRHSARKRPRMGQIVQYLEGEISLEDLNVGMKSGNSEVKGNSSEQEVLRTMAFGGINNNEGYVESDWTSEYELTSRNGANMEEILNRKDLSVEL